MSAFGKNGKRCDWCGKIANNVHGEYLRPVRNQHGDQLAGYIQMRTSGGEDVGLDICCECAAGGCPCCASDQIIQVSPATPGPTGWGGRCKACGQRWGIPAPEDALVFVCDGCGKEFPIDDCDDCPACGRVMCAVCGDVHQCDAEAPADE